MRAVRGAERVVDINLRQRRKLLSEGGVVFLLLLVEADVFQQQHLAVLQRGRLGLRVGTDDVGRQRDVLAQQLGQALGDGRKRIFRVEFALRAAHVRAEDHPRVVRQQVLDRRQRADNAVVVGDTAVLHRDVEVAADEHSFARDVDVLHALLG